MIAALLDGRRLRRLADADPDEEGPPGAHPQRAGRRRPRRRGPGRRSSGRPPRSACASSRSASTRSTVRWSPSRSTASRIAVKLARHDGVLVNAQPEYDDVVARRGRPRPPGASTCSPRPPPPAAPSCRHGALRHLMDLVVIALTFAAIFVVELPDKTFLATLVLSTKYRPLLVWIGVGAGVHRADDWSRCCSATPRRSCPRSSCTSVALADVPGRRGDALPRGPQPPPGRARTRRSSPPRPRTCTGWKAVLASLPGAVRRRVGRPVPAADDLAGREVRRPGQRLRRRLGALLAVSGLAVVAGRALLRFDLAARAALRRRRRSACCWPRSRRTSCSPEPGSAATALAAARLELPRMTHRTAPTARSAGSRP